MGLCRSSKWCNVFLELGDVGTDAKGKEDLELEVSELAMVNEEWVYQEEGEGDCSMVGTFWWGST